MSTPRAPAAQFFMERDDEPDIDDIPVIRSHNQTQSPYRSQQSGRGMGISSRQEEPNDYQEEQEVAELLTRATVISNDGTKLGMLRKVTEIIVHNQPALLDNFLDEMLNFQSDSSLEIRKYLLEFLEQACEKDPEIIPKVASNIQDMLSDLCVTLQKRAIQAVARIYESALAWLCKAKTVTEEMEETWHAVTDLKRTVLQLIDSDNDGIRTHAVKFMEIIILLQTPSENDSAFPSVFCLDKVPITLKIARPRKLEEDAKHLFEELLKFYGSRHATSVNLMACMGSIALIAKLRPSFMGRVITAMEKLNAILPPTLERSQVSSVRKHMKIQLMGLLKHPRASNYYDSITTLLTDLGATNSELNRAIPNWDEIRAAKRKRQRALAEEEINKKRAKLEEKEKPPDPLAGFYDDDDDTEKPMDQSEAEAPLSDMEKSVYQNLSHELAVELVLASVARLPDVMPAQFISCHTPIATAGTDIQIKHVARLLTAQIIAHQLGPEAALQASGALATEPSKIPSLVASQPAVIIPTAKKAQAAGVSVTRKIPKPMKLSEITKPLNQQDREKYLHEALKRILEHGANTGHYQSKLIASIVVTAPFGPRYAVMQFITSDIKNRMDLGMQWIFAEYTLWQGYASKAVSVQNETDRDRYDWTFYNLMKAILENAKDCDKSTLAWQLYTEPPVVPDRGRELLRSLCAMPNHAEKTTQLLLELACKRSRTAALHYLGVLLEFCSHALEQIRDHSVNAVLKMHDLDDSYKKIIEDHSIHVNLKSLRLPQPPDNLFEEELGRKDTPKEWNENTIRSLLHLYFELLMKNHTFLHELPAVYVEAISDVKRAILRYVEVPIRKLGIRSPEILKLLDTFPKGAETLITRILHILTDKTPPTPELVSSVNNIYSKRFGDVRFLIPVLNGLSKTDILAALPKLIKLNPNVVKEVFNRLLGTHADASTQQASPIKPEELMVALHNIEPSKCDVKTVIKATTMCFNETEVFTPETLAMVINQLVEQAPLPTLLMRTVIQALALHPKLSGFVTNTLNRLVTKQVWTQPKIWEGFIKCCQRIAPKGIEVLLTIPPEELRKVLYKDAPDLRQPLMNHLMAYSEQQRACMPSTAMAVIFGGPDSEIKREYGYDSYGQENSNLTDGRYPRIKEERRSPGPHHDMGIALQEEHMEYRD